MTPDEFYAKIEHSRRTRAIYFDDTVEKFNNLFIFFFFVVYRRLKIHMDIDFHHPAAAQRWVVRNNNFTRRHLLVYDNSCGYIPNVHDVLREKNRVDRQ